MDIRVVVAKDGSATVTTDWDVTVTSGTEWYIPVGNLGPMKVTSLKVSEDGKTFVDEGFNWDSGRSLEQKRAGAVWSGRPTVWSCAGARAPWVITNGARW